MVADEPQGGLFLDLQDVQPGETWTINTPRGAVQTAESGHYEILAGDATTPTRVAIVHGAAQFTSGDLVLRGSDGQMLVASGNDTLQGDVKPSGAPDPFLASMLARTGHAAPSIPAAASGMTGAGQLASYGNWQADPQYGEVWYPQVDPSWVPYSDGSWSYVEPWGWTWVDAEPWGFAPFHYGRWFRARDHWGWIPGGHDGPRYHPTYAPALVDFLAVGTGAGLAAGALTAALLAGHGHVGWVPLGPHEFYQPAYRASRPYLGRLNRGGDWHRPSWNDAPGRQGFLNRSALTVAPATALLHSARISAAHGPTVTGGRGSIRPLEGGLPRTPGPQAPGLPVVATQRGGLSRGYVHPLAPGPGAASRPRFRLADTHPAAPVAIGAPIRLPRIVTPHSPSSRLPGVPMVTPPIRPTLRHPELPRIQAPSMRPAGPRLPAPPMARPGIVQPRFAQPGFVQPRFAQPGMAGARIGPMLRPAPPSAPRMAPAVPGRPLMH